jgi:uncharacterized protein YidB (DUF937 family)
LEVQMNLSKPLILGLGALLVGRMLSGGGGTAQPTAPQGPGAGAPPDGGLAGGLGGLLQKLQNAGHGDTAKSWVGPGQNQPIDPGQLRSALGQKTVSEVAQQAGINEQEFLSQLSQNLPQFVDQLTPNGRVPSLQEIAAALTRK